MEYTCSNFNLRLVKSATATDSIIDIGDKMLGEPDLVQVHSTELVSFARSEFQQAFHYGGIGHELTVSRYYGPYSDYSGSEVNALLQAELNASKAKYGTLTVDVDGVSGGSFQMLNAALNDIVVLQGPQYGKGFAIEYRYSFGDMVDISTTKLLDRFEGAAGAYSLRELSAAWAGQDVVEVREDGGDTLQSFTAAELTDGTLATFCGANNGYVKTWYDQSGNANNATQATNADQPKIYNESITNPFMLRYYGGYLWWSDLDTDSIYKRPVDSDGNVVGASTAVLTGLSNPKGIWITDAYIYWVNSGTDQIQRADIDGTNIIELVGSANITNPIGVAVNDNYVFWSDGAEDKLKRADIADGANVTEIYTDTGSMGDVFAYGGYVYSSRNARLYRCDADGSNVTFVTADRGIAGLYVDDNYIYMSNSSDIVTDNSIRRMDIDMDASSEIGLRDELDNTEGIAVFGNHLYYGHLDATGGGVAKGIRKLNLTTLAVEDVTTGLITEDGLPAIDFDGNADRLQFGASVTGINNIAAVARCDDASLNDLVTTSVSEGLKTTNAGKFAPAENVGSAYFYEDGFISLDGVSLTANKTAQNNQIIFAGSSEGNGDAFAFEFIAGNFAGRYWDGTIQEVVVWTTKQLENRTEIEVNMNRHFQLY